MRNPRDKNGKSAAAHQDHIKAMEQLTTTGAGTHVARRTARPHTLQPHVWQRIDEWTTRHAARLVPRFRGEDAQSPFYRIMGCNLANRCSLIFLRWERNPEKPLRRPLRGGELCGSARATSPMSTWSGSCALAVFDESTNNVGKKRTAEQSPRHHRSRCRRRWTRLLYLTLQPRQT